ncbi:MAG: carbamate kinase [Candidatus Nanopelagicales bacterium]
MRPLAVVAIGGNALTGAGQEGTAEQIADNAAAMARCVATLGRTRRVVVVHGNGPQVGNLSIQQDSAADLVPAQPLYQLGAMTQGQLGSVLVREIDQILGSGAAAALITHVEVDLADPAFGDPVKPVGPFFNRARAGQLAKARGWQVREDSGRGYRRVVASPRPTAIVEISAIRALVAAGHVVVAAGGGGIPVSRGADGSLSGVDGVIDKDHAAAALAAAVGAEDLYLLTGVDSVMLDFGTPQQRPAHRLDADEARTHLADGQFAAGSMGPKVEAALAFLAGGGQRAIITSARMLPDAATGKDGAGTHVVADVPAMAGQS